MALRPLLYIDNCHSGITHCSPFQPVIFTVSLSTPPQSASANKRICPLSCPAMYMRQRVCKGGKAAKLYGLISDQACLCIVISWLRQTNLNPEYRRLRKSWNICIFCHHFYKKEFKLPDDAVYCTAELYVPNLKSSIKRLKCPVPWTESHVFAFKLTALNLWNSDKLISK